MLTNGSGEPRAFHRDVSHQIGRQVQAGQKIECPFCDATHILETTVNPMTKQHSSFALVFWCAGLRYLGAVGGACVVGSEKVTITPGKGP